MLTIKLKISKFMSFFKRDKNVGVFIRMAWPATVETVLVGLISVIDTVMVGGLGKGAIAAVGITNQPKLILLSIIFSLNIGLTAIVSRRTGQSDRCGANCCHRQALIICFFVSIVTSFIGYLYAKPIMEISGASSDYINDAADYFKIIMISVVLTSISLTINAAQRGAGNTKIAMRSNVAGNIVNLFMNYMLINGVGFFPRLEVKGAAIATVLGSAVACALSVLSVVKRESFISLTEKFSWRFDSKNIKLLFNISSGAMTEQLFIRIGFFVYAMIVAKLGTASYAAHQICMNVITISYCFGDGIGTAASTLVGQSLGAKSPQKAVGFGQTGQKIAFAVSTVLFFTFIFGRNILALPFTDDTEVISMCSSIFIIIAFCTHAQTSQVVLNGCLKGAGDTKYIAVTSLISIGIIRPFITWLLCIFLGYGLIGAWISLLIDHYMRLVFSSIRFKGGKWLKKEF
ncbi:MAG: MATE family efflux transporter [Oscillospiraceae bacterium]